MMDRIALGSASGEVQILCSIYASDSISLLFLLLQKPYAVYIKEAISMNWGLSYLPKDPSPVGYNVEVRGKCCPATFRSGLQFCQQIVNVPII